MEITKDMQIVIDYCIENNIKYKTCEYVAKKGSDYKEGTIVSVLYIDVGVVQVIEMKNKFSDIHGFSLCRLADEKGMKKIIEKGFHSALR